MILRNLFWILFCGTLTLILIFEYSLGTVDFLDMHQPTIELGHSQGALIVSSSVVAFIWIFTMFVVIRRRSLRLFEKTFALFGFWIILIAFGGPLFTRLGTVGDGGYHLEFLRSYELVQIDAWVRDSGGSCLTTYRRVGRQVTIDGTKLFIPYFPLLPVATSEFDDTMRAACCSGCTYEVR
jgi:hypothetical protein